jgi:hypothetical protein
MTLPDAITILVQSWDDVVARLDDGQRAALIGLTGELLHTGGVARRDIALDIMDLLTPVLPPGHPVRRAFAAENKKFDAGAADWDAALTALRHHTVSVMGSGTPGPGAPPESVRREAERSLLAFPALDAGQVRRLGADPRDPVLIRLETPGGGARLPAFQFGRDGRPLPVVAAINRLLDAEDDPWGVADWWLGPNAWIDAVPAEVLGRVADQVLIGAARAVVEEA